jgi:hypothetical protein
MENLKESLPLVIIPSKTTRKNYDPPTHSITNSGGTSSEILDEDDELDNPSDCQCYSPHKTWQSSSSPKYQDSEESSDNDKPKSPLFNKILRLPLFCTLPLPARAKPTKVDESNGNKTFQSMTEQLNNAMSKLTSAPSSPKSNSKEDELQMKLETAEKKILSMSQQLIQKISSNTSPLTGGSPMPYDTTRAGTDKADVYDPLKLGVKVMKIMLCDNGESNKTQVNTLDNCKLASQLQRKLEIDQLRNFSLSQKSYSRDASPKPSNDASPRPSGKFMEAGEILDTRSESNSSSKAQNEVLKTEISSMVSLDPVLMSAKKKGIEKAPTDTSLEDELQRKIDAAKEKVFSLSLDSNWTSSSNTPMPFDNSMAPAEGEDEMSKLSGNHKISKAGDGSIRPSDPVVVTGKDALARASARNNFKEIYSNGSSKLQQKLEATKSQIQLLSKELSQVSSENNKFHADLDTLKISVATISATLMDRSKVRIAQLSSIEKRLDVPQKNT